MKKKISNKDKKDWENFLDSKEKLQDKDSNILKKKKFLKKSFDLHGFTLEQANKKIKYLINEGYENNVSKLVIVTGKGLHSQNEKDPYVSKKFGILKHSVPQFVYNTAELMEKINSIEEAKLDDGGSGAFYINLKKKPTK